MLVLEVHRHFSERIERTNTPLLWNWAQVSLPAAALSRELTRGSRSATVCSIKPWTE